MDREIKGSVVAMITPMNEDNSIDWEATADLIEWHIKEGTDALVPVGTTGESPTLSHQEHRDFVTFVIEKTAGRVPVIAGASSNSTREAVELTQHAKEAGADAAMSVVPYYNRPTQNGLIRHFAEIADNADIPIILYNIPSRTGTDMLPETVGELSEYKNIIGIKEATGEIERVKRIKELCGESFLLFSGDDGSCCEFMLAGGHGCISVTANVMPALMHKLCALATQGKESEARMLQEQLLPLHNALVAETNPIPAKYALALQQKIKGGIRLPLTKLSEARRPQLEAALQSVERIK